MFRKLESDELNRISPEKFKEASKLPVVIVLDNLRSLNNVGSVFRTSDAFRIEKIYLCGITAFPPNREIHKTALGAEDTVDWEYAEDTIEVIEKLRTENYRIFAAEQTENSISLETFRLSKTNKYALIFGNEVKGVQQAVIDLAEGCIEIPQFGTKHSFNISVSVGIILWELSRPLLSQLK